VRDFPPITPEKYENTNPISWKRGLHIIKSSIADAAKISSLMRRMEAFETNEPVQVNQVSPNQFSTLGCTYHQAMNYVFEEIPIFNA